MSVQAIKTPSWWVGSLRLWLFELGTASCLGVGLMCLLMAIGLPFWDVPADISALLIGLFLVSVSAAIAWQFNRLAATEWLHIVPQYQRHIIFQSAVLLSVSLLLALCCQLVHGTVEQMPYLLFITFIGLLFIYICLVKVDAFFLLIVLYFITSFSNEIAIYLPIQSVFFLAVAICGLMSLVWRKVNRLSWQHGARNVYLNGLEMGGIWLPLTRSAAWLNRFDRYLHPANYFIGPTLTTIVLAMPLIALALALGGYFLNVQFSVFFLLMQFSAIACAMLHWSRIQRWRAVESLFVLPGFDGKKGMINAFMLSQYRLLAILTVGMVVTATLTSVLSSTISLSMWLHIVLSHVMGCAVVLGLGAMCRTSLQISVTIFFTILQTFWVTPSLLTAKNGGDAWFWIAWDIPLLILAFACLWYSKYRLWRGDLLSI